MTSKAWLIIGIELVLSVLIIYVLLSQMGAEKKRADASEQNLKPANATINDMQVRQRDVAALDAKYTKELADANAANDALRRRLDNGGRVRVKGSVPLRITPPPPAAWAMQEPSNSLTLLDETFSVSVPESSATRKP